MMDHERTEKELQGVFQEIQQSYKALVDNAFALQERTLDKASRLHQHSSSKLVTHSGLASATPAVDRAAFLFRTGDEDS